MSHSRTTAHRLRSFTVAAVILLGVLCVPPVSAKLLPPAGTWPAPVTGATNPLLGTPNVFNGSHASANASLRVWFGSRRRSAITRTIGRRTVVRGRLRDRTSHHSITGAVLELAAQNLADGSWYLAGAARTNHKGRFKAVLPAGPTRRVGVLYWPFVNSPGPVFSRRLLARSSGRVYLKVIAHGRSVLFRGKVSGAPIPSQGLIVAAQVRNAGSWVSVRLARTQASGRFRTRYRFKFAHRGFAVRASAPSQSGWPLYSGRSRVHRVRT